MFSYRIEYVRRVHALISFFLVSQEYCRSKRSVNQSSFNLLCAAAACGGKILRASQYWGVLSYCNVIEFINSKSASLYECTPPRSTLHYLQTISNMKLSITVACFALCAFSEAFVVRTNIKTNVINEISQRKHTVERRIQTPTSHGVQTFLQSTSEQISESSSDLASTTPQLLASLWLQISRGCKLSKGETDSVLYPNMEEQFTPSYLESLMGHLDVCKDVCDDFGVNTILTPIQEKNKVTGFTVKSYKDPNKIGTFANDGNFEFAPDPYFDNDDWDLLDDKIRATAKEEAEEDDDDLDLESLPEIENKIPDDDEILLDVTKKWVNKVMSDMGICPFTKGADLAGLPMGKVFYTVDRSTAIEEMYARYWEEVVRVEQSSETELSTTLLIAPEFLIDNVEMFENFSSTLTQPLETLNVEVSIRTLECIK